MPDAIFTLGYQQRTIAEYVALLRDARIDVLIDVRETAWSHKSGFSKSSLQAALKNAGIQYVHASFAGNPKWLRENASSHAECLEWYGWYLDEFDEVLDAFEALVGEFLATGRRAAITCFERHADDCHRSVLASRWMARRMRRTVRHLGNDGCPRLLPT
jgi:uncharacterized protein (DUF488 family)